MSVGGGGVGGGGVATSVDVRYVVENILCVIVQGGD